jgi:hypothetical protein
LTNAPSVPAVFEWRDVQAIADTFCAKKATPLEIVLRLGPKRRSKHFLVSAILLFTPVGFVIKSFYDQIDRAAEAAKPIMQAELGDLWTMIIASAILLFVVLPKALLPSFELVLRPKSSTIVLRGMGFEQERLAGCCNATGRLLWSTFFVDSVGYSVLRRWWQTPLPTAPGVDALGRILAPAQQALADVLERGGGQGEVFDSVDRMLWATVFGEAFVSETELAVLLPTPVWHMVFGWVLPFLLLSGASWLIGQYQAYPDYDLWLLGQRLSGFPPWLPPVAAMLYAVLAAVLADSLIRRAMMVIPKGRKQIELRVGKRVRKAIPIDYDNFALHRGDDIADVGGYIAIKTRGWSGTFGPNGLRVQQMELALLRLLQWAGVQKEREGNRHG